MALLPQEQPKQIALVVGIAALAVFYLVFEYWYSPRVDEVEQLQTRLTQLQDRNRQAQVMAARGGADLEERLAVYERHVTRLEQLIPQSEEVPVLLNNMAREAQLAGVEIASMRPEPAQVGEFYTQQSYEIAVVGEFHSVGQFLSAVGSMERIVNPVDLQVELFTGDSSQLEYVSPVTARFRIQTYVLPGPRATEEIPALPEGATQG